VPALGAYDEFSIARPGIHFHRAVTAATHWRGGFVPDCVLVTDIVRDRPADCVDFIERLWEKGNSARPVGHYLQCTLRALRMLFIPQNRNRINRRPVFRLQVPDS